MKEITIGGVKIGKGHPAFIIAEVSCNHEQDYTKAIAIIQAAAEAGVDAVKIQTYTPDTMTIDCDNEHFIVKGKENPDSWKNRTFYDLYKDAYTPWEWDIKLKKATEDLGMVFFSTPFDPTAVDFLETLDVPCYKIASYEATYIPLLKRAAQTGKPIIMSVGFASLSEIEYSVKILRDNGAKDVLLLHCTTSYEDIAKVEGTNLSTMEGLRDRFDVVTGFSDNMGGIEAPILAASLGAAVIEKHVVIEHDEAILDDRFSLDKNELKEMVGQIRRNEKMVGKETYGCGTKEEEYFRTFRRSLFVVEDIKKGEVFTEENMRAIRPSDGLETRYYEEVLGSKAKLDMERGTPLSWNHIEKKDK